MKTEIENLLEQVLVVVKKYDDRAAKTGENFNIFSVLKLDSDEVRLHSRLLGELLNPKGSHGKNELFLKLFISTLQLEKDYADEESLKTAKVLIEENIGSITEDYLKGGRIDIVVKFPNQLRELVIENKIYAKDQENQLGRYFAEYPDANIIYLTPLKKEPSKASLGLDLKLEKVLRITYKDHIKAWLEKCLEKTVELPLLRETLTQYLYLIKKLTHQTTNDNMKNELIDIILSNKEHIKGAFGIYNVWEGCQTAIIKSLESDFQNIAQRLDLEYEIDKGYELGKKDSGFWFYKKDWCYCIYFVFVANFEPMRVIVDNVSSEHKCTDEILIKLKNHLKDFNPGDKLEEPELIWGSEFKIWEETHWENIKSDMPIAIEKMTKIIMDKLLEFKA
jgi:hypothetical protein